MFLWSSQAEGEEAQVGTSRSVPVFQGKHFRTALVAANTWEEGAFVVFSIVCESRQYLGETGGRGVPCDSTYRNV